MLNKYLAVQLERERKRANTFAEELRMAKEQNLVVVSYIRMLSALHSFAAQ